MDFQTISLRSEHLDDNGMIPPHCLQEMFGTAVGQSGRFENVFKYGRFFTDQRHCIVMASPRPVVNMEHLGAYSCELELMLYGDRSSHLILTGGFALKSTNSASPPESLGKVVIILRCQGDLPPILFAGPAWVRYIAEGVAFPHGETPVWEEVASFCVPAHFADRQGKLTAEGCGHYIWDALERSHSTTSSTSSESIVLDVEFRSSLGRVRCGDECQVMLWQSSIQNIRAYVTLASHGKVCVVARLSHGEGLSAPARLHTPSLL